MNKTVYSIEHALTKGVVKFTGCTITHGRNVKNLHGSLGVIGINVFLTVAEAKKAAAGLVRGRLNEVTMEAYCLKKLYFELTGEYP